MKFSPPKRDLAGKRKLNCHPERGVARLWRRRSRRTPSPCAAPMLRGHSYHEAMTLVRKCHLLTARENAYWPSPQDRQRWGPSARASPSLRMTLVFAFALYSCLRMAGSQAEETCLTNATSAKTQSPNSTPALPQPHFSTSRPRIPQGLLCTSCAPGATPATTPAEPANFPPPPSVRRPYEQP